VATDREEKIKMNNLKAGALMYDFQVEKDSAAFRRLRLVQSGTAEHYQGTLAQEYMHYDAENCRLYGMNNHRLHILDIDLDGDTDVLYEEFADIPMDCACLIHPLGQMEFYSYGSGFADGSTVPDYEKLVRSAIDYRQGHVQRFTDYRNSLFGLKKEEFTLTLTNIGTEAVRICMRSGVAVNFNNLANLVGYEYGVYTSTPDPKTGLRNLVLINDAFTAFLAPFDLNC